MNSTLRTMADFKIMTKRVKILVRFLKCWMSLSHALTILRSPGEHCIRENAFPRVFNVCRGLIVSLVVLCRARSSIPRDKNVIKVRLCGHV